MSKCPFAGFNKLIGLGPSDPDGSEDFDQAAEDRGMQRALKRGKEGGGYRDMLVAITRGHSIGQKLRGAMFVAGLMQNRTCYTETVVQFYTVTAAFERQLERAPTGDGATRVRNQLQRLKMQFSGGYEEDLAELLGSDWRTTVSKMQSAAAREYVKMIEAHSVTDDGAVLAAAAFILWGPLVIGGGKSLERKIAKAYGKGVTHVFEPICKLSREEHDALKDIFASVMDELPGEGIQQEDMVEHAAKFMHMNNALMRSVNLKPWLFSSVIYVAIALVLVAWAFFIFSSENDITFE